MNQPRYSDTIHNIFKFLPWWKYLIALGMILSVSGVLAFWGTAIDWLKNIFIFILICDGITVAFLLQMRLFLSQKNASDATFLPSPWGNPVGIPNQDRKKQVNITIYFLFFLMAAIFFLVVQNNSQLIPLNFAFFFFVLIILINSFAGYLQEFRWLEEISDGLLTVFFPIVFSAFIHQNPLAKNHFLVYGVLVFCVYLAFRFVFSMSAYDHSVTFQPGLFPTLIRQGKFRTHHLFVVLAAISLILFNRMGVYWRLLSPQLLVIPSLSLQIIYLEKVMKGMVPNWKIIGSLALINVFLVEYFQIITVWFE